MLHEARNSILAIIARLNKEMRPLAIKVLGELAAGREFSLLPRDLLKPFLAENLVYQHGSTGNLDLYKPLYRAALLARPILSDSKLDRLMDWVTEHRAVSLTAAAIAMGAVAFGSVVYRRLE